ncbi:MAG: GspE/PulE family protein [Pseudomonadota bacterium]
MKKRLGDILIEMGFIGEDQLRMAISESKKTNSMMGDVLLRLSWITEEQLQIAIAVQSGAELIDTASIVVDQSLLTEIPLQFVTKHGLFPFAKEGDIIKAATSNPFDVIARDELARLTGHRVITYIAPSEWISNSIELYYKTAQNIDVDIENITRVGRSQKEFEDNKIITLADRLIEKGHVLGASDIHVAPDVTLVRIYYRIDGVLHQNYLFPIAFHKSLVTRFKIMGDIDISNPNIPHDGRIKYRGPVGEIDIRVSIFPTHLGETVVMRLLSNSSVVTNLSVLGLEPEDLERFLKNIRRPYGLIISTGPTGSGKTTTLYSALMAINSPDVNVMTVEDPIEYIIPTIRQTAINAKAGLTFSNALRAAMRQDPDIMLVGEMRDQETADLALRASMTGHLVLSTLHTNDAASAINRLLDFGISPGILASSLTMVIAQRLLRKICPHCAATVALAPEKKEIFLKNGLEAPDEVVTATGCDSCHRSGYSGRSGIYEVIKIDRVISELIFTGALSRTIEDAAVEAGTTLMFKQALKKVARKVTSLEEVYRVVADA